MTRGLGGRPPGGFWRGHIEAVACLYSGVGQTRLREAILRAWSRGDRVLRLEVGLLHIFGQARRVRVDTAAGFPVVDTSNGWTTLDDGVFAAKGSLRHRARGGVQVLDLARAEEVDVSAWLGLSPTVVQLETLGLRPAPPPVVEPTKVEIDLRARAGVDEPDPKKRARFQAAAEALSGRSRAIPSPIRAEDRAGPGAASGLWGALKSFSGGRVGHEGGAASSGSGATDAGTAESGGRSGVSLGARLRTFFTGSGWLFDRHRRVLDELARQFKNGDLDEALRNAIPLGTGGDATHLAETPNLSGRAELKVGPRASGSGAILAEEDQLRRLRDHYRAAFRHLSREGRHQEAAFVLAELLGEEAEAVAYLERAKTFRLAAELAEAREMDPALRVRLWVRAGDWSRAIRLAVRYQCFAVAAAALADRDATAHHDLKRAWAGYEMEVGNIAGAVKILAPSGFPESWFDQALALGGVTAARVLPMCLTRDPGRYESVRSMLEGWLERPDAPLRELCEAANDAEVDPELKRGLLSHGLRRMLAKGIASPPPLGSIEAWLQASQDDVLQATWPRGTISWRPGYGDSGNRAVSADDRGTTRVLDAVRLQSERWVVALGEGGLLVLAPDGRRLAHRSEAVHRLVMASAGHRALGLTRRGAYVQISEIDLATFSMTLRTELELTTFDPVYDGREWAIGLGAESEAALLSLSDPIPAVVWRSRSRGALQVAREGQRLRQLRVEGEEAWLETFDLGAGRLEHRQEVELGARHQLLPRFGRVTYRDGHLESRAGGDSWLAYVEHVELLSGTHSVWAWVEPSAEGGRVVNLRGFRAGDPLCQLSLPDADHAGVHEHAGGITVYDEFGRLEHSKDGAWIASIRL